MALTERMLAAIGIPCRARPTAPSLSCFHAPAHGCAATELDACAAIARRTSLSPSPTAALAWRRTSRALLGKPLTAARGHVHKVEGVRTVATFHPRFLINRPSNKALAWRDLLLLMEDEV